MDCSPKNLYLLFLLPLLTAISGSPKTLQKTEAGRVHVQTKDGNFNQTKLTRRQQIRLILGYCSNGNEVIAACFPNHICGRGYWCDKAINRCCLPRIININIHFVKGSVGTPTGSLLCRDGSPAASRCPTGRCPMGYVCTMDRLCCRSGTAASCNFEGEPLGLCYQGMCDAGHYCSRDGFCCPRRPTGTSVGICPDGQMPISLCLDGICPTGHQCVDGRFCCPFDFYDGQMFECPNNAAPVGPCVEGLCPDQYACINNVCCPTFGENQWYDWPPMWERSNFRKGNAPELPNKRWYKGKV
uniref:CC domain-containing protein n=1 Tax=Trichuris muris TaxID=70415 RepID=A0A5S6R4B1_TRIMR